MGKFGLVLHLPAAELDQEAPQSSRSSAAIAQTVKQAMVATSRRLAMPASDRTRLIVTSASATRCQEGWPWSITDRVWVNVNPYATALQAMGLTP